LKISKKRRDAALKLESGEARDSSLNWGNGF